MTRLETVLALHADSERMTRPGEREVIAVTVGQTTDNPQVVQIVPRRRDVSDDAMAASYARLRAAEELAAEFGDDISEWTV